jgi:hypothetical protein
MMIPLPMMLAASPFYHSLTASLTSSSIASICCPKIHSFLGKDGSLKAPGQDQREDGQGFPNQISPTTLSFLLLFVVEHCHEADNLN